MKTTQNSLKLLVAVLFFGCTSLFGQSNATYEIKFTSVWNAGDHGALPGGAHWSNLIGANHQNADEFLEMGMLASTGIENVAELGSNGAFINEINAQINTGLAEHLINVTSLSNDATGTITLPQYTFDIDHPFLTLASMIAPSPDWFIAINSFNLREGGNWNEGDINNEINIDLFPYDAGTEEGTNYSTSNSATNPHENISNLINNGPFNATKVGTLTITLESVLSISDNDFKSGINVSPNPSKGIVSINNSSTESINNIQVFDVIGKLVKTSVVKSGNSKIELNLQELNSGIYLIKVNSTEGKSSIKKLVLE